MKRKNMMGGASSHRDTCNKRSDAPRIESALRPDVLLSAKKYSF
jgi:hypothetical protein